MLGSMHACSEFYDCIMSSDLHVRMDHQKSDTINRQLGFFSDLKYIVMILLKSTLCFFWPEKWHINILIKRIKHGNLYPKRTLISAIPQTLCTRAPASSAILILSLIQEVVPVEKTPKWMSVCVWLEYMWVWQSWIKNMVLLTIVWTSRRGRPQVQSNRMREETAGERNSA